MLNRNERFLKKAIKTLPKLQKDALIGLSKELIHEKYSLLNIIELNPTAICLYLDKQIVFKSYLFNELTSEIPNLIFLLDKIGVQYIQDCYKKDRIFNIVKKEIDHSTIIYITELTTFFTENMTTKTKDSLLALENLAAGISHEIKNPLSAIDLHTQLLNYKIDNNKLTVPLEIITYLNIVKKESDRLLKVLDNFLNITRKSQPILEFTEVSHVIDTIANLLEPELSLHNIILSFQIDTIPKIFTSPYILQQVILDLIRNSIESLENIKYKQIEISIKESNTKTHIIISIDDSGIGLSIELKYKIFDPYFTTKKNGTGLGLTLVKKMLEELNGEIYIGQSSLGGAKFDLYLPISKEFKKLLS
ncbi:MAG: GHKL domain-containing protein [Spirochaetota bacterium]|nr:GHKL domain-containing protein [Spirochaetota bacterium]